MNLLTVFTITSTILALFLTLAQLALTVSQSSSIKAALKATKKQYLDAVLQSGDMQKLGSYLYDEIGIVAIQEYVLEQDVQRQLQVILDRVDDFLNPPQDGTEPTKPETPPITTVASGYPELEKALSQIQQNDVWNGLARLRLTIEKHLRAASERLELDVGRSSAGRLVQALASRNVLPPDVAHHLSFAVSVANRGVHGEDVTVGEAIEAVNSSTYAFARWQEHEAEARK